MSETAPTTVLVVDDDPLFRSMISKVLHALGSFTRIEATSVAQAKKILQRRHAERHPIGVLLTDFQLEDGDGLDLIETLPDLSPSTMPILMSGIASPRDLQSALRLGAIDVLIKPFSRDALSLALQRAIASTSGFRGNFHGMSLADLLQMLHLAKHSLILEIRGYKLRGIIALEKGEMVHAEASNFKGMDALVHILSLQVGSVSTFPSRKIESTLDGEFQSLLLDAFRILDEHQNSREQSPDEFSEVEDLQKSVEEEKNETTTVDIEPQEELQPVASSSEQDALVGFVSSLDPELGTAWLSSSSEVLLVGNLSVKEWENIDEQAIWLASEIGEDWTQFLWILGDLGLALFRLPGGTPVLFAQRFRGLLDDRRFRWNVACVAKFLSDDLYQGDPQ